MGQVPEAGSMTTTLAEVDPVFAEVCQQLYGGAVDPREAYDIVKSMPDQASMHVPQALVAPRKAPQKSTRTRKREELYKALHEASEPILAARRAGQIDTATALELIAKAAERIEEVSKLDPTKIIPGLRTAMTTNKVFAKAPTQRARNLPPRLKRKYTLGGRQADRMAARRAAIQATEPSRKVTLRATLGAGAVAGTGGGYLYGRKKGRQQGLGAQMTTFGKAAAAPAGPITDLKSAQREKKLAHAGLVGNAIATTGGAHAMYLALKNPALRGQKPGTAGPHGGSAPKKTEAKTKTKTKVLRPKGMKIAGAAGDKVKSAKPFLKTKAGKVALASGVGWVGLHGAELAADAIAARSLNNSRKAANTAIAHYGSKKKVSKVYSETRPMTRSEIARQKSDHPIRARLRPTKYNKGWVSADDNGNRWTAAGEMDVSAGTKPVTLKTAKLPGTKKVSKSEQVDYTFAGEISKVDSHQRLAFGWCHLSEIDGKPHYDLQGDYAPIEEIEKSAYVYVRESRKGGDMHLRDGDGPKHTADLVESMVVTPEKLQKMGLSEEASKTVPVGWWVGFKVNDDEQWQQVLSGERAGFSIHGKGARVSKVLDDA